MTVRATLVAETQCLRNLCAAKPGKKNGLDGVDNHLTSIDKHLDSFEQRFAAYQRATVQMSGLIIAGLIGLIATQI